MSKTAGLVIAAVLLAGAAFAGGYFLATNTAATARRAGGPPAAFAQLSESERQALQSMSAEERQAFFREKGIDMPEGAPQGGPTGDAAGGLGGPGGRTRVLEGTISAYDADKITVTLTAGGSATAYVDADTVLAATKDAVPELKEGAAVVVISQPEADGVDAASAVIVK